ncbi:dNA-binding helix-turn-helix protein [Eubacterium sp. CAG:76]|nr:dNA-binding helix-turn-helix protein [Eubacterium sp. CAG:76]
MSDSTYKIIKELRQNKHMSQNELAKRVGLTQQAIALIENGKRKLDLTTFINILKNLDLTDVEMEAVMDAINKDCSISQTVEQINEDNEREIAYQKATIEAYFNRLNKRGKSEAVKRIGELAELDIYIK